MSLKRQFSCYSLITVMKDTNTDKSGKPDAESKGENNLSDYFELTPLVRNLSKVTLWLNGEVKENLSQDNLFCKSLLKDDSWTNSVPLRISSHNMLDNEINEFGQIQDVYTLINEQKSIGNSSTTISKSSKEEIFIDSQSDKNKSEITGMDNVSKLNRKNDKLQNKKNHSKK